MTDIRGERSKLKAQGLDIIERETWDAQQDYRSARAVVMPAVGFFLHISVTIDHGDLSGSEHADMRTIERIGQERFGIGYPYNAASFDTGRLYEGQPLTRRGAHTVNDKGTAGYTQSSSGSLNPYYRALCLPQMVTDDVTDAQIDAAARWAAAQIRAGLARPGATWSGHRDVAWKACPGDAGYDRLPELNKLTRHYEKHGLQEDDFMALFDNKEDFIKASEEGAQRALKGAFSGPNTPVASDLSALFEGWMKDVLRGAVSGPNTPVARGLRDVIRKSQDGQFADVEEALEALAAAVDA